MLIWLKLLVGDEIAVLLLENVLKVYKVDDQPHQVLQLQFAEDLLKILLLGNSHAAPVEDQPREYPLKAPVEGLALPQQHLLEAAVGHVDNECLPRLGLLLRYYSHYPVQHQHVAVPELVDTLLGLVVVYVEILVIQQTHHRGVLEHLHE